MAALTGTVVQEGRYEPGHEYTAIGSYTLVGAITNADTITWTNLLPAYYAGIQILAVTRWGQELDTNASPSLVEILGDGSDTDGYITSATSGDATGQFQRLGDGALIGTAPASRNAVLTTSGSLGTAASTGTVWVAIRYYCKG